MPLSFYSHTFAANPLDRAGDRRADEAWLARRLEDSGSLAVALWNGQPLVETGDKGPQIAYLRADMAQDLSGGPERMLFMGLWKETAVFALGTALVVGGVWLASRVPLRTAAPAPGVAATGTGT